MQYHLDAHETDDAAIPPSHPNIVCQVEPSYSMANLPAKGTATQKVVDKHDTDTDWGCSNTEVGPDHAEPL
jgi:hypothetical protein